LARLAQQTPAGPKWFNIEASLGRVWGTRWPPKCQAARSPQHNAASDWQIGAGEIDKVRHALPADLRALWPISSQVV
jgi:hypothetical protein